jgi:hypothetical protein
MTKFGAIDHESRARSASLMVEAAARRRSKSAEEEASPQLPLLQGGALAKRLSQMLPNNISNDGQLVCDCRRSDPHMPTRECLVGGVAG